MNIQEFSDLLHEMEIMVLEAFLWPKTLIVDPTILEDVFGVKTLKIVKYKLPSSGEIIPVVYGKPGEFRIEPYKP